MTSDNREQTLARIEAKLDALLGIRAAPPEPSPEEIRDLLARIDAFHSQVTSGFSELQGQLDAVIAGQVAEAARVRAGREGA